MNKVFLIGRLSRDPELRHPGSGMVVCQINVAISRRVGAGRDAECQYSGVSSGHGQPSRGHWIG